MKLYLRTEDFSVSNEAFDLLHDEERDMLVTWPQPKNLEKYYDSKAYISHTDSKSSLVEKLYQIVKRFNLRRKLALAESYSEGDLSIFDIGSGTGDFLMTARRKGWSICGVEPNALAREKSKKKGVEVLSEMKETANVQFQIITLWHVFEHLPDLEQQIGQIKARLKKTGTLILAVPNFKSYDAKHYQKYWAAYDVPRHLWHFSRKSIESIFAQHQMKVVKIKPMRFDSFYVSMLSEKYKGSRFSLLKGFVVGFYSNLKAVATKEHSSLIYVLKKS